MNPVRRLTDIATLMALMVVLLGAWTRLNDAGLACPDWPGCYGEWIIPHQTAAQEQAQLRFPEQPLDVGRGWIEMSHRYLAGLLGLLVLLLCVQGWRYRQQRGFPRYLIWGLGVLVIAQALFGMWTVTLKLLPQVVVIHLLGGLLTLSLLIRLRQRLQRGGNAHQAMVTPLQRGVAIGLLLLFLQLGLGGWTSANYAGWACSHWLICESGRAIDFDFEGGFSLPAIDQHSHLGGRLPLEARAAIQMAHRLVALLLAVYLLGLMVWLWRCSRQAAALVLLSALVVQLSLGALNVTLGLPLALAMAHHAGAVLLLAVLLWLYQLTGSMQGESHHD